MTWRADCFLSAAAMFFSHLYRALEARRGPMLRAFHTVAVMGPLVVAPRTVVKVMPLRDRQADHTSPLLDSHADAPRPLRPTHALRNIRSTVVPEGTSGVRGPGSYLYAGTSVRSLPPSPDLMSPYHRWPQAYRAGSRRRDAAARGAGLLPPVGAAYDGPALRRAAGGYSADWSTRGAVSPGSRRQRIITRLQSRPRAQLTQCSVGLHRPRKVVRWDGRRQRP